MRPTGSAPSISRMTLLVGLLAATALFASILAYEAHDAARAERVTAERALADYATLAGWEFQSASRKRLEGILVRALGSVTTGAASSPYEMLPGVEHLRAAAEPEFLCQDGSPDSTRIYFRLDLRDGSLSTIPAVTAQGPALSSQAQHFVRDVAKPESPLGVLHRSLPDPARSIALGVRYARLGAPVAVYGFTVCASALAAPLFRAVLRDHPLLPAAARATAPNDSLFAVVVRDADGDTTFASFAERASPFASETPLDAWDGWRAKVAIRNGAAAELLVRPPVRSRVPLFLGLLVMTASLAVVAMLQMRREHELARLRADFTSSVSHELRTPLAQILLFGETLSLGRARGEAERLFAAETIVQEARRLMRMVDNVLAFSRGRRDRRDVEREPVVLGPVVEAIVAGFAPLAHASGTRVDVRIDGSPTVIADAGALRQIVLNLLDNAVKYGPTGQTVRVDVRDVGDAVCIAVEDEGAGIAPTDRERIWNPYVRLRREAFPGRGTSSGGSGIGLAVVRELTESLGGRVWVETAARGGARFVVALEPAPGSPPISNIEVAADDVRNHANAIGTIPSPARTSEAKAT